MNAEHVETRSRAEAVRALIPFFWTQRVRGYDVPDLPHFDEEGTDFFGRALAKSAFYIEYGSGGSTVLAARLGKKFISVDSDKYFLKAVRRKIGALQPQQILIHSDIGINGPWGIPVFKAETEARRRRWSDYPEAPWRAVAESHMGTPDLILVDGRFRVACALTCLKYMMESPDTVLLVDDYRNRPNFQVIEEFASLEGMAGRMGIFRVKPFAEDQLRASLSQYLLDWR
jgi:hypothetical protein